MTRFNDTYSNSVKFVGDEELLALFNSKRAAFFNQDGSELYSFNVSERPEFSFDNELVLVAVRNPTLHIRDESGKLISKLEGHTDDINSVAVSSDESRIASASSDKKAILWDKAGRLLKIIHHDEKVNSVSFSSDGQWLATASDDEFIRIFDQDGNPILDQLGNELRLSGHTDNITSVLFSPDGRTLVSASTDNTIRLWDVTTWEQKGSPIEISDVQNTHLDALWFSENGNILAYGIEKAYVRLLNHRFQGGTWIKDAIFHPVTHIPADGLPDSQRWLTVQGNRGMIILSLGLEHSMIQACDWVSDYLNANDDSDDDALCDGILDEN